MSLEGFTTYGPLFASLTMGLSALMLWYFNGRLFRWSILLLAVCAVIQMAVFYLRVSK